MATRIRALPLAALTVIVLVSLLLGTAGTARAATRVELGTAGSFAVLAGSTITNTGPTTITGDVGLHPGTAVSGFNDVTLHGQLHVRGAVAAKAKDDLVLAYDSAAGQGPATTVSTELGGQRLLGGVYDSAAGTFGITGTLTLDAQGTPSTVWVFQADSTLITATASRVNLVNGASACNVFWQVGSSATLGTSTSFAGNILALQSVTLDTSATIRGRALARNGAVTMDTNTISTTGCAAEPGPSPSPVDTATDVPTDTATGTPTDTATDTTAGTPTDTATDPTAAPTGTAGTPAGPEPVDATPVTPAPPSTGTPQVPDVPTGSIAAGDGSTATTSAGDRLAGRVALPAVLGLVLFAVSRRRAT